MSDLLVIKCQMVIKPKDLEILKKKFIQMKEEGVVVLPAGFEVIVVPKDVEIKVEGIREEKKND